MSALWRTSGRSKGGIAAERYGLIFVLLLRRGDICSELVGEENFCQFRKSSYLCIPKRWQDCHKFGIINDYNRFKYLI